MSLFSVGLDGPDPSIISRFGELLDRAKSDGMLLIRGLMFGGLEMPEPIVEEEAEMFEEEDPERIL